MLPRGGAIGEGISGRDPGAPGNPGFFVREGVGQLIKIAVEKGRHVRSNIKIGICGEHGGDPDSINFFDSNGLDYVSCSPFRVPIAFLAIAQNNC